jgi:hypothetical protein
MDCIRLYGLLIHFCYWNIIHPAARSAIDEVRNTHQRTGSFCDLDYYDQFHDNRVDLLPELMSHKNHTLSYDHETMPSFIANQNRINKNNGGKQVNPVALAAEAVRHKFSVDYGLDGQSPSKDQGSQGGGIPLGSRNGAKSIDEIDQLFNKEIENPHSSLPMMVSEGQTEDQFNPLHHAYQDMMRSNDEEIEQYAYKKEKTTNVPFQAVTTTTEETATSTNPNLTVNTNGYHHTFSFEVLDPNGDDAKTAYSYSSQSSLSNQEKEQLFIQLETCITTLFQKASILLVKLAFNLLLNNFCLWLFCLLFE